MKEFVCPTRRLYLSSSVVDTLAKYSQKRGADESGGILLGNVYPDYDQIKEVTTPGKLDRRGPMHFHRSRVSAQARINAAWISSAGSLVYLGEWHTHSQIVPEASGRDRRMLSQVFAETLMDLNHLYLIVVGQTENYWVGIQTPDGLHVLKPPISDKVLT